MKEGASGEMARGEKARGAGGGPSEEAADQRLIFRRRYRARCRMLGGATAGAWRQAARSVTPSAGGAAFKISLDQRRSKRKHCGARIAARRIAEKRRRRKSTALGVAAAHGGIASAAYVKAADVGGAA